MKANTHVERINQTTVRIQNTDKIDIKLFANEQIAIENTAIDELLKLTKVNETIDIIQKREPAFFSNNTKKVEKIALTPDFHKGSGVPIGTVIESKGFIIPQAIGNDVNCGMRLHTTDYSEEQVISNLDKIEKSFRHLYFQGGRNIPMNRIEREALLKEGLPGLYNTKNKAYKKGIWELYHEIDQEKEIEHTHLNGGLKADAISGLEDFVGHDNETHDTQIGSIGGGNHFVEIQVIDKILDGQTAHAWNLKPGKIVIMVHSGSVMIGHLAGARLRQYAKSLYANGLPNPQNGIFLFPTNSAYSELTERFKNTLYNAANFAYGNRMFLALLALQGFQEVIGEASCELLYDAPHNFVWENTSENTFIHRKGACPARGFEQMQGTPFEYFGEPVLVPGSMGAPSYILAGCGNEESLWSASHGAGRQLSRGKAIKENEQAFNDFLAQYRVVTPIDFNDPQIRQRPEIIKEKLVDLKKEAPFAYKNIEAVINTLNQANIAKPVPEVRPLLTVKG